ncbi:MAG: AMP-binding protein [Ilumatobacteraceae bacterium]
MLATPARMTRRLVAVDMPGGPAFVDTVAGLWDAGDACFVLDRRYPTVLAEQVLDVVSPAAVLDADGEEHERSGSRPVEDGDALVVATGGSTGAPRGVVLTHDAVAASAAITSRRLSVTDDDHWLACLPLAHIGGLSVVTRAMLTGTALTVLDGFDPDAVMASGATLVSLVPTALKRVDPTAFRAIVLGGSAPPVELPGNAVVTYGMTETASGIVYDGVPLDDVDVRLADDGEIMVAGPTLLRAYRDGRQALVDGWFATDDLGSWDSDGRLVVHGRRGDLIITGGENVWPDAVEAALRSHPLVADAGVAGRPDPEWGAVVTAFVVPSGAIPTLDQLREHVKLVLPAYAAPRSLHIVGALARTPLGKLRRDQLATPTERTPAPPSIT